MKLGERELSKLRWRCRRGLLENDLFIERFFNSCADTLTVDQASAVEALMELADNDLMDLFLGRKATHEVSELQDSPDVRDVLCLIRSAPVLRPSRPAAALSI
jgi:antitoxin CptB